MAEIDPLDAFMSSLGIEAAGSIREARRDLASSLSGSAITVENIVSKQQRWVV